MVVGSFDNGVAGYIGAGAGNGLAARHGHTFYCFSFHKVGVRIATVGQRCAVVHNRVRCRRDGQRFRRNRQRAFCGYIDIGEIFGYIVASRIEDVEGSHLVHRLFACARRDVRHRAVGGGRPGEAIGNARHREVLVRCLRQRRAVVHLGAVSGDYLDKGVVGRHRQRPGVVVNRIVGGLVDGGVVRGGDFRIAGDVFA